MSILFKPLYFVLYFIVAFDLYSIQLQMDVFDVGQGNFIILHTPTHALVVDCGCTKAADRPITYYTDKYAETEALGIHVRSILKKETRVIITHDHVDHQNLLDFLAYHLGLHYTIPVQPLILNL